MHPKVGVFVGLLALSLANCSSRYRDDCQAEADCEGGNDADVDACVDGKKAQEDIADAYDCGDAFNDAADCLEGKGVCENAHFSVKDPSCDAKRTALAACEKAASSAKHGNGLDQ